MTGRNFSYWRMWISLIPIWEEKILGILDKLAPLRNIQMRTKYSRWITDQTKLKMTERDTLKEVANRTQDNEDWAAYRLARNSCTNLQRKDRNNFLQESYKKLEEGERHRKDILTHQTTSRMV